MVLVSVECCMKSALHVIDWIPIECFASVASFDEVIEHVTICGPSQCQYLARSCNCHLVPHD